MEKQTVSEVNGLSSFQVIEKLRKEALTNPVFKAVCSIFAIRERSRGQVTASSLQATMIKEGYKYTIEDYRRVLAILAGLGIGTLDYDRKNKLRSLKQVKMTLQSIGLCSLSQRETLETFIPYPHRKYKNRRVTDRIIPIVEPEALVKVEPKAPKLSLRVSGTEDNTLVFNLPDNMTFLEFWSVIISIYGKGSTVQKI